MLALSNNKPIWVRDSDHGFLRGRISDIGSDNVTVQLLDNRKVRVKPSNKVSDRFFSLSLYSRH